MTRLRAILDRINDIEATIARMQAEVKDATSPVYLLNLESLESRKEVLKDELEDATRESFVEVCDYRIIPDGTETYAISAVTSALQYFQELVTIAFDAITDRPKQRASRDPALIQKTAFEFGFAYSGSLGIALVIRNDREFFDSDMDRAVAAVFEMIESDSRDRIHNVAAKFGRPAVRKLYAWSKTHSEYGLTADIKWVRDGETRNSVLAQPQQLSAICELIEARNDPYSEPVTVTGMLASWDTVHRRFIIDDVPGAESVSGTISEGLDVSRKRTVKIRYTFDLLRHTVIDYAMDREKITWELLELTELN